MKKSITILLLFSVIHCFSQGKLRRIERAEDYASSNFIHDADTIFNNLDIQFPNDSLLLRREGNLYWTYGRVKRKEALLDRAILNFNTLKKLYPNNSEIALFIFTAEASKLRSKFYNPKTTYTEKKQMLSNAISLKKNMESELKKIDPLQYKIYSFAKSDIDELDFLIKDIE